MKRQFHKIQFLLLRFLLISHFSFSQKINEVKIGNQVWSQNNFDGTRFLNGEVIHEAKNKEDWYRAGFKEEPAWCYYKFDSVNEEMGKLYNYYAVSDIRSIAPLGWRTPTFLDYYILINFIEPLCTKELFTTNGSLAGGSLKIKDNSWIDDECQQINSYFSAVPTGGFSPSLQYPEFDWIPLGERIMFWCITDWSVMSEFIDSAHVKRFNEGIKAGEFSEKALVLRLWNYNCKIDSDDDPKINGYYLRLIKQD